MKYSLNELQAELDSLSTRLRASRDEVRRKMAFINRVLHDIKCGLTFEEVAHDNKITITDVMKICELNGVTSEMIEEYQRRHKRNIIIWSIHKEILDAGSKYALPLKDLLKKYNLDVEKFDEMIKESIQDRDWVTYDTSVLEFELNHYDIRPILVCLRSIINKVKVNNIVDLNMLKTTMEEMKESKNRLLAQHLLKLSDYSLREYCEKYCELKVV